MKSAFFCSTPYHIMTATTITVSEKLDSDIYVFDEFADCDTIIKGLKKSGVFNSVIKIPYKIDPKKHEGFLKTIVLYLKVLNLYLHTERYGKKVIGKRKYDRLYVFHLEHCYVQMFSVFFVRHFKGIQLYCYEDGNGTYYYPRIYDIHFLTKIYHILFVGKVISKEYYRLKVFSPDFYKMVYGNQPPINRVEKIQSVGSVQGLKDITNRIFSLHGSLLFREKHLFLDTVRIEDLSVEGINKLEEIIRLISNKGNFIIKDHPRDNHAEDGYDRFDNKGVPLEFYCFSNDFNGKVLYSLFSSASFTPKLLFDQEPTIVFLYKLLKEELLYLNESDMDLCCDRFKRIYRNPDKIYVPETLDELKNIT